MPNLRNSLSPKESEIWGWQENPAPFAPTEQEPGRVAAEYVKHLEEHPLDTDVRERLAVLYADHYHRLDLAADQLEQMITLPNQPAGWWSGGSISWPIYR
jgi:hypothetical protein